MRPLHQQRVVNEKEDLDLKLAKLLDFIGGDIFETLADKEKHLLVSQVFAMNKYSSILADRIIYFGANS